MCAQPATFPNMQRCEDKQAAARLAQSIDSLNQWLQDTMVEFQNAAHADKQPAQCTPDADAVQYSNTFTFESSHEQLSAKEAAVALEYIDHVKELRDATAELEQDCEEQRQECSKVKVGGEQRCLQLHLHPTGVLNRLPHSCVSRPERAETIQASDSRTQ
jgi:hypothetical protein